MKKAILRVGNILLSNCIGHTDVQRYFLVSGCFAEDSLLYLTSRKLCGQVIETIADLLNPDEISAPSCHERGADSVKKKSILQFHTKPMYLIMFAERNKQALEE